MIAACFALANVANKYRSPIAAAMIVVVLVVVSGLRTEQVGIDNSLYHGQHFRDVLTYGAATVSGWYDTYYVYLMEIVSHVGTWYLFTLVISLITYSLIIFRLWELRDLASFPCAVVIFLCLYWPMSLNISRQFLAVALVFWGSRYFFKMQYFRFLLIVIVAILMHRISAIALGFFVLLPLYSKDLKGAKRTLLSLAELLVPIAFAILIIVLYANYADYYLSSITVNIGAMGSIKLCFVVMMLIVQHGDGGWKNIDSNSKGMIVLGSMGIVVSFVGYFFSNIDRIALFYLMYEPILYGMLIKHGSKTVSKCTWVFVCVLAIYSIVSALFGDTQGIIPYSACSILQLFS